MSKIPKEIVDKIEQRNKLNEEIEAWCKETLIWMECARTVPISQTITPARSKEMMNAKNGASSGQDIVKMTITVIITGKQSIQKSICIWIFGFKGGGIIEV